jgi:acetyltransferase-like isoleucine patch superfamily enzyme
VAERPPLEGLRGSVSAVLQARRLAAYWLRAQKLKTAGATIRGLAFIDPGALIQHPRNLEIGSSSVIGRAQLFALDQIVLGAHAIIGDSVFLCAGSHNVHDPSFPTIHAPIEIGDYVWLANGSTVLPGVRIGRGAVIGARSVVTENIEEMAIVAGNPARKVGERRAVHDDGTTRWLASADPVMRFRQAWSGHSSAASRIK